MCGASTRWSMPRIHAGRSQCSRATSSAAMTIAQAPSVTGKMSASRNGACVTGRARSASASTSSLRIAYGLPRASRADARRDLGELTLTDGSRLEQRARLQPGEVDQRRPQGRDRVRIALQREHLVHVRQRRLPEAVDQRAVDLAGLDRDPRLVERPRRVHLDVALPHRRPRARTVEALDEGERATTQVVAGARDREADVVAAHAGLADRLLHHGDDELDLVALAVLLGRLLRERDDPDVSHS